MKIECSLFFFHYDTFPINLFREFGFHFFSLVVFKEPEWSLVFAYLDSFLFQLDTKSIVISIGFESKQFNNLKLHD